MNRKRKCVLRIDHFSHPTIARIWCKIFGHTFNGCSFTAGGEELCNRCNKYKDRDEIWGEGDVTLSSLIRNKIRKK